MGDRFGHVKINAKDYRIDLNTYRGRDVSDFSPRVSTPGGSVMYSELGLYQTIAQTDWRHGFGFWWHTDSSGYSNITTGVDTRFKNMAMLVTDDINLDTEDSDTADLAPWRATRGFTYVRTAAVDFVVGYGETGCFIYRGDAGLVASIRGFNVKHVWTNGTYTFFAPVGTAAGLFVGSVPTCDGSARLLRTTSELLTATGPSTASGGAATYLEDSDGAYLDDQFNGQTIFIVSGTGAGQYRQIDDTVAATQRLTVTANWTTPPDATSVYRIVNLTQTGVNANSVSYEWITSHDGYIFAGKSNYVYYASTSDLSDMHGSVSDDPAAIVVGPAGRVVRGAISYNGDLYFAREDGLYRMEKDRSAARKVLDYSDQIHPYNFQTMVVFNGNLVFPIGNQLYQWNGVRVSPITPPYYDTWDAYTSFRCGFVRGNFLYILATAKYSSANGRDHILCFDGVGWHQIFRSSYSMAQSGTLAGYPAALSGTVNFATIPAMGLIATGNNSNTYPDSIWFYETYITGYQYSGDTRTKVLLTGFTNIIRLSRDSEYPYPYYQATSYGGSLITSRMDAGFRRIQKSLPSLLVYAKGLSSGHQTIRVYYRLNDSDDTGNFTAWGGSDGTTNVISTNGVTELTYPLGSSNAPTIEFYWIQFQFRFYSDSTTATPILEGYMPRMLMRPDTDYGYSFNIIGASDVEYSMGQTDGRTPKTIIEDLHTARDSKAPIVFVDPFGVSHYAYLTSVTELAVEEHVDDMGAYPNIEQVIQVNIVTVT